VPGFSRLPASQDIYRLKRCQNLGNNGSVGGVFLIFAKTNPEAAEKAHRLLVEPSFQGFKSAATKTKWANVFALRRNLLNDCEVARRQPPRRRRQGLKIALSALDGGRNRHCRASHRPRAGPLSMNPSKYAKQRRAFGEIH